MSTNKYKPHLSILLEDDANRQIANGFILNPNLDKRAIEFNPLSQGWRNVLKAFEEDHIYRMRNNNHLIVLLVIDFDKDERRLSELQAKIPSDLKQRVFILGTFSEPEELKKEMGQSFESIGKLLADDCVKATYAT